METIQHMLPIEIWTKIFDYSNRETINNTLLFMVLNERKSKNKYITNHSKYIILKNYKKHNSFLKLFLEILDKTYIDEHVYTLNSHINLYTKIYNIYSFSGIKTPLITKQCYTIYLLTERIKNKKLVKFLKYVYAYPFRMIKNNEDFISRKIKYQSEKDAKKISVFIKDYVYP